jgi:hypothetical protein
MKYILRFEAVILGAMKNIFWDVILYSQQKFTDILGKTSKDGGSKFPVNISKLLPDGMAYSRRQALFKVHLN